MTRKPTDAAAADVGVEARDRAARAMVRRFARHETLEDTLRHALGALSSRALDDAADREAVLSGLMLAIRETTDARFLRELLGADPADRMTRMHAHGALLDRATKAAWRLAGGED